MTNNTIQKNQTIENKTIIAFTAWLIFIIATLSGCGSFATKDLSVWGSTSYLEKANETIRLLKNQKPEHRISSSEQEGS